VARQRLVYHALREEFETGLHALSLDLKTPSEAGVG
jgi:BolA family transcriptional regulator, general stress-responsive regulator